MLNLLSLDEAAEELNVSPHTMRARVFQRRFATVKLGRWRMVERDVLERFVRSVVLPARTEAGTRTTAMVDASPSGQ